MTSSQIVTNTLLGFCLPASADGHWGQRLAERPAGEAEQRAGWAQQYIWEQVA